MNQYEHQENLPTCFIISPIGQPGSDTRRRADQTYKHIIAAAVEPLGYECLRADEIASPGLINEQVMRYLSTAPLVVADLSELNPNVFYELAVRHIINKPVVQIIGTQDRIPFDVATMRTIEFSLQDPDSVARAKEDLSKQIHAIRSDLLTPIRSIRNEKVDQQRSYRCARVGSARNRSSVC